VCVCVKWVQVYNNCSRATWAKVLEKIELLHFVPLAIYSKNLIQKIQLRVPSYYCLYSLYNKIRNKGKIVSAGYW
jgi:hypothetical protein